MSNIKDSGSTREFDTGAHRDNATGKGRCDLLPMPQVSLAYERISDFDDYDTKSYEMLSGVVKNMLDVALETIIDAPVGNSDYCIDSMATVAAATAIAEGMRENIITKDIPFDSCNIELFWYGIMQVSKHYEEGAVKYGANNWMNGMPLHVYYDSACRHLMKARAGMEDEPHIRAACWNALCFMWTKENKPELDDFTVSD